MTPLATLLGPVEVKLGLAAGLIVLLVATELASSWVLGRLGLAGRGRAARVRAALALALPLLLLAPRLEGHEILVPSHSLRGIPGVPDLGPGPWDLLNDSVFQFLPWEAEVRRALADGHLPLWSDRLQSSPWSNPQAQVASPVAIAARLFPLEHFLLVALALKVLLAFDGAWALAGAIGVRPAFRHLAGVSFALGGGLLAWAVFPQSSALALVPWLAAAAVRLARGAPRRRRARAEWIVAALATAAVAVGGHPEIAVAGGTLAAVVALGYRRRGAPLLPAVARLAGASLAGLALAAPLWLPFAFEVGESQRFVELAGERSAAAAAPASHGGRWFDPAHVAMLRAPLGPEVFGRPYFGEFRGPFNWVWAEGGYAGLAALAGAAAALAGRGTRRRALPLLLFALLALLASARFRPLMALLETVRPLRAVALERALPVATLALAVAGALGVEGIARRRRAAAARALAFSPALVAGAVAAVDRRLAARTAPRTALGARCCGRARRAASAATVTRRRRFAALALAAALVVDLGLFARDFLPAGFARQLWPPSPLLTEIARRGGDAPFRVAALGREAYPAALAMHGLEDVRVHDPLADQRYLDCTGPAFGFAPTTSMYFAPFELHGHPLDRYVGLRFVLARAGADAPTGWSRLESPAEPDWIAFESPAPLSRFFLARRTRVVAPGELAGAFASLDDAETILVAADAAPAGLDSLGAPGGDDRIELVARRDGRYRLATTLAGERVVATSLIEPEGWRVESGRRALPRFAIHGAFLGFVAPAGANDIDLSYRPPGLATGVVLALVGALALLLVGATPRRRARPAPRARR
ncbi:MAG: hypothetical protein H6511_02125 [Holophagales bacterium]|nr:hypothetical protein [Holophagales bacterium]